LSRKLRSMANIVLVESKSLGLYGKVEMRDQGFLNSNVLGTKVTLKSLVNVHKFT